MTRFLQIGTSRFLQAHVDLFIDHSLGADQVCVVQSSGNAATAGRLAALTAAQGYPVRIRGLRDGQEVDEEVRVRSISHTLSTANDWDAVLREAATCEFLLSNVSEKGYIPSPADSKSEFDNAMSYVAKLYLMLQHRFEAKGAPLSILPLELFESNGDHLKKRILERASASSAKKEFVDWLNQCVWVNSLVDRIVSAPIEPAGAVAEPYALWAVQDTPGLELPILHPAVKIVEDLQPYQVLKLYILNLSHTYMANNWQQQSLAKDMTVRDYLGDANRAGDLTSMQNNEIIPGFEVAGLGSQARDYVTATMERFRNPFLEHYFSDIIDGHQQKVTSRAGGFLKWARANGDIYEKPLLDELRTMGVSETSD